MAEGAAKNRKRLEMEYKQLTTAPPPGVTIKVEDEKNYTPWTIFMKGPEKSPYEKGNFKISCIIPPEYPFKPPDLSFTTKIYHPNIKLETGEICTEIYRKDWAPTKKISDIISLLFSMLQAPNMESPLEADIAKEFQTNYPAYQKKCQEYIEKFAK